MWKVLGEDKMLGDASRHCLVNINGPWEGLEGPIAPPSPTPPFRSPTFPPPTPSPSWGQLHQLSHLIQCLPLKAYTPRIHTPDTYTGTHTPHDITQARERSTPSHPYPSPKHLITVPGRSGVNLITFPQSAWHGLAWLGEH